MTRQAERVVRVAKKYVDDFPLYYDATSDPLSSGQEHAHTVNELLMHLRAVLACAALKKTRRK